MLAALALLSAGLIVIEFTTSLLEAPRSAISSVTSPLRVVAETPYLLGERADELFATRRGLQAENAALKRRVLELSQVSQQFLSLRTENERLRELLGSRRRAPYEVLVAELIGVIPAPDRLEIVIDKGANAGLAVGQAVVDADGLFGQIIAVDAYSARVLLLTDAQHAVPAQINRTGQRGIVSGSGAAGGLTMDGVATNADVREGDLVVSSGLGGRFPAGYPIGRIQSVIVNPTSAFAEVTVMPFAQLDRSRHVLVIFSEPLAGPNTAREADTEADAEADS